MLSNYKSICVALLILIGSFTLRFLHLGDIPGPTFVYGIRVYKKGSVLIPHRDKLKTHIISAIINVDQEIDEEWPLIIEDNYYRKHHVFLNPGEVIFYESARLDHGRPFPLKGNKFANIFCHFMPVNMEEN